MMLMSVTHLTRGLPTVRTTSLFRYDTSQDIGHYYFHDNESVRSIR